MAKLFIQWFQYQELFGEVDWLMVFISVAFTASKQTHCALVMCDSEWVAVALAPGNSPWRWTCCFNSLQIKSCTSYVASMLYVTWRQSLCKKLHQMYFSNILYYHINVIDTTIDNPYVFSVGSLIFVVVVVVVNRFIIKDCCHSSNLVFAVIELNWKQTWQRWKSLSWMWFCVGIYMI